ncbi:MAG TPA: hypothetical protein VFK13_14205 [Gemmatimonadaceae bacterium]|nr:hypothetical protein [Gemmatimonadaceae bacterium]
MNPDAADESRVPDAAKLLDNHHRAGIGPPLVSHSTSSSTSVSLELHPPAGVLHIARRLEEAGFEAWCVGGAVRDALLGHPHLDWDLATSARPDEVRRLFRRTVPVGIEFGTVGVLDASGVMHEVTTFRRDVRTDGRHAEVAFGVSLEDDLARRDFTINALAYSASAHVLRDPFGGRDDLARGVVRAVGDAAARMREDRLRALRGIRFAARFGFRIEHATWEAIRASAPHLGRLSPERVRQEMEKTMDQVERPSTAFALWKTSGALATLVPALAAVSELALATVDEIARPGLSTRPQRRALRIAALLLELGGRDAERALRALRFSNAEASWIARVVEGCAHLEPVMARALLSDAPVPELDVRRWVAHAGRTRTPAVFRLAAARWAAQRRAGLPAPAATAAAALYRRAVRAAFRDAIEIADLAIDGDDLQRAGIPAGPHMRPLLEGLLARVVEDPTANVPDVLLARAREMYASLGAHHGRGT